MRLPALGAPTDPWPELAVASWARRVPVLCTRMIRLPLPIVRVTHMYFERGAVFERTRHRRLVTMWEARFTASLCSLSAHEVSGANPGDFQPELFKKRRELFYLAWSVLRGPCQRSRAPSKAKFTQAFLKGPGPPLIYMQQPWKFLNFRGVRHAITILSFHFRKRRNPAQLTVPRVIQQVNSPMPHLRTFSQTESTSHQSNCVHEHTTARRMARKSSMNPTYMQHWAKT